MKATEQYFPVVLFILLYEVVLTFESVNEILKCDHSMKATEQYFPVERCYAFEPALKYFVQVVFMLFLMRN